jgi:hypothetical protein
MRDIEFGISKLDNRVPITSRREEGSKFLGCVIQWERPAIPADDYVLAQGTNYISRVRELIDGQQRISTVTLLLCELYYQFDALSALLDKGIPEEAQFVTFLNTVQDQWLLTRFSRPGSSGASPRRRPTVIRQGTDKWIHAGMPQYRSSLAQYVHSVVSAIESGSPAARPENVGKDISDVVEAIRELLSDRIASASDVLISHYDQTELLEDLYGGRSPVDIKAYLAESPPNEKHIRSAISLIALVHYLFHYCAFTVITSPNQDTALDMFQSLNATGVQLTAVQLLKPRVSLTFRQGGISFSTDSAFSQFDAVNSWLNTGRNSASKTAQFFLKFGLGIFGEEPPNSLSGQRSWLQRRYLAFTSNGTDVSKARELIRLMSHYKDYLTRFYFPQRDMLFAGTAAPIPGSRRSFDQFKLDHLASGSSFSLSEPVVTGMMFLIDAKHDLAHSFLALFFAKFQEEPAAGALVAKQEFEKMVLAVVACFVMWRATFLEKYPDAAYRRVLAAHSYAGVFSGRARPLARALFTELRRRWRQTRGGVPTGRWVSEFAAGLQYRNGAQALLRFVLILAAHRRVQLDPPDSRFVEYGIVASDPSGPDYLYPDLWLGTEYRSLEHVAPQKLLSYSGSPVPHWSTTFSSASTALNSIGNLTLLSLDLNASVPEDTPSKKNHYEGLVAPGASAGVTPTAASLMMASPLLSHLVPVYLRLTHWLSEISMGTVPVRNSWDEAFISRRASNVAAEVAKDLIEWIRAR